MIENLVLVDWVSIALILVFAVTGFFNGFIKEIFSFAAWVLSLAIAWLYGPLLFPYVQGFANSESIKNIISFILFFLISFVVLKTLGSIISKLISVIGLKGLDRLLGMFFGSLKVIAMIEAILKIMVLFLS